MSSSQPKIISNSSAFTASKEWIKGTFHLSSSGILFRVCFLPTAAWVTPGMTWTPVFLKMLLNLDPVKDVTSAAETNSKNLRAGFLDFLIELTDFTNLANLQVAACDLLQDPLVACPGESKDQLDVLVP